MTKTNLPPLIIQVTQTGFIIFAPHLSDTIQVDYPPDTVRELEVINDKNLVSMIEGFIGQYQIPESEVIIVLDASVYFEKEIAAQEPAEQDKFIQEFTQSVPLESVFVRKFEFKNQIKAIAFNKLFYKSLVRSLSERKFVPKILVPDLAVKQILGVSGLTRETAQLLVTSLDKLKKYNLLSPIKDGSPSSPQPVQTSTQPQTTSESTSQSTSNKKTAFLSGTPNKKRLYLMIATFVVLLLVLGTMVVRNLL